MAKMTPYNVQHKTPAYTNAEIACIIADHDQKDPRSHFVTLSYGERRRRSDTNVDQVRDIYNKIKHVKKAAKEPDSDKSNDDFVANTAFKKLVDDEYSSTFVRQKEQKAADLRSKRKGAAERCRAKKEKQAEDEWMVESERGEEDVVIDGVDSPEQEEEEEDEEEGEGREEGEEEEEEEATRAEGSPKVDARATRDRFLKQAVALSDDVTDSGACSDEDWHPPVSTTPVSPPGRGIRKRACASTRQSMMEDLSIGPDESSNSDASSIRSVHTSERPVSISAFPANIDPALQPSVYVRQLEAASTTRPLTRA